MEQKKLLTAADIETPLPFKVSTPCMFFDLGDILYPEQSKMKFDFDVYLPTKGINLQRPLVWSLFQKQEFIMSVLLERGLPPFYAVQRKEDSKKVDRVIKIIDGKQRLTTLVSFVKNEFPIQVNGRKYYFDDLDKRLKHRVYGLSLNTCMVHEYVDCGDNISDDDLIKWFCLINFSGTPQDKEHMLKLTEVVK